MSRETYMIGFGWDRLFHKGCVAIDTRSIDHVTFFFAVNLIGVGGCSLGEIPCRH